MNQYPHIKGVTDLATINPKLALEWNYEKNEGLLPEDVMPGTDRKVWWRCLMGHEWQARVYSRSYGAGCPYCAGNVLCIGVNDLATKAPHLLKEWDYEANSMLPENIAAGSATRVSWVCSKGHKWDAVVSSRVDGRGCPYCSGKKVWQGFNDLSSQNTELASEWDYERNGDLLPTEVPAYSSRKVWWLGKCGHSYEAKISNRMIGTGCPYCCGKKILKGFNDFQTMYPKLAQEWNYGQNTFGPDEVTIGSQRAVWWRCDKGHEWKTAISNRIRGTGCPFCAGKKPIPGSNDFKTMNPDLMLEWNYEKNVEVNPSDLTYQSRRRVWWMCKKHHEWRAEIFERVHGQGCPICAKEINRHVVNVGVDDLATLRPDIAEEWDYERNEFKPNQVLLQSNKSVWWICKRGHHWRAKIQDRAKGNGCPRCSGKTYVKTYIV